jgi:tetratricopeptide (TPR) repeat protein/predicted Ser/Thr protein kinase
MEDETGEPDLTGKQVGRYLIRSRLGSGGMGELYLAQDTQLRRQVALKHVGPRYRNHQNYRQYLLNEARRASALNDSRVAGIYDVFEHDTDFFVVMEYVDGITLRKRMEDPLSVNEFLQIAIPCLQGLSAAHEKEIVHGDLKPENIMVSNKSGDIKICDFGLARRAFPTDESETVSTTTEILASATVAGTPAYMAPEALAGKPLMARADIFSLGVTFYEMLAGKHPFRTGNPAATAQRIIAESPPSLHDVKPEIPLGLSKVISRMLEKDPERRFKNAREVLVELENGAGESAERTWPRLRKSILPVAVLVCLSAVAALWTHIPGLGLHPAVRNLVVLPFESVGSTAAQRFQSDGLTETLNAALVKVSAGHGLQVSPASEVQARHVKSLEDARKELGATLVLTGTVQYSDTLVRVNAILTDGSTKKQLRAETVTVDSSNPFLLQDRIVEAAVGMLGIQLVPIEQADLQQHGTLQPGAYEFYLQGRGYLRNFDRPENLENAILLFQNALKVDPHYSLAFAGLGEALWRKYQLTSNKDLVGPALTACKNALSYGSSRAEAHLCLGTVYTGTGEYMKAVTEFNRTLELDPTMDVAYLNLGIAYEKLQQFSDAERIYKRAIDLRPDYWAAYSALGNYYFKKVQFEPAVGMFKQVVQLAPDSYRGYSNLGVVYQAQHRNVEAIAAFEKSLSIRANFAAASNLGAIRFYEGDYAGAARAFRQAVSLDDHDYLVWGNLGSALHWAGQQNESVKAYTEARRRAEERLNVNPLDPKILMSLAEYNGSLGFTDASHALLKDALKQAPEDPSLLFKAAIVYDYDLKRRDDALQSLRKAIERNFPWEEIDRSPSLSDLRNDHRFAELRKLR